jgi:hypothetical protein
MCNAVNNSCFSKNGGPLKAAHVHQDPFHCRQNLLSNLSHPLTSFGEEEIILTQARNGFWGSKMDGNVLRCGELVHKTRVSQSAGCLMAWVYIIGIFWTILMRNLNIQWIVRGFRFSHMFYWGFRSSGMWYCYWVLFSFFQSKHSAFIFRGWGVLPFNHWSSRHPHVTVNHQIYALVADWQAETELASIVGVIVV